MDENVRSWVHAWFEERNPDVTIDDQVSFYAKGYVDSFGIIEFIHAVETHFSIQFEDAEFKADEFRTIAGVSEMIAGKIGSA